jgi:hypothetical protein
VLASLAADDLTAHLQVRLAAAGGDLPTLSALLQRLAEGPHGGVALHGDVLAEAVAAVQQATGAGGTEEEWLAWETAAAASPDARLRRVALAALTSRASRDGWTPARCARLAVFAEGRHPLVASAAQFTFPPEA